MSQPGSPVRGQAVLADCVLAPDQGLDIRVGLARDVIRLDIPAIEGDLHGQVAVKADLLERRDQGDEVHAPAPGGSRSTSERWTCQRSLPIWYT